MEENLGCVLNGHKPRYFGIYRITNRTYGAICVGCDQKIQLIERENEDKAEWKLTSDA